MGVGHLGLILYPHTFPRHLLGAGCYALPGQRGPPEELSEGWGRLPRAASGACPVLQEAQAWAKGDLAGSGGDSPRRVLVDGCVLRGFMSKVYSGPLLVGGLSRR